jgi:DNA adenine methylase
MKSPTAELVSKEIRAGIPKPNRVMAPVYYFGGKGNLAKQIIPHIPFSKIYVEPFCGAASVFWHLNQHRPVEVLNDLNDELITLFRVLQDKNLFEELAHRLTWTPYSLSEFKKARRMKSDNPVDIAWAYFVKLNQGFSGTCNTDGNWSRVFVSERGMAKSASTWRGRLHLLDYWHDRLTRVQIDCRGALEVIQYWDSKETTFYIDPPYVHSTRKRKNEYAHECEDDFHSRLVEILLQIKGQAVLSGYAHDLYLPLKEYGWYRVDIETVCYAAGKVRTSGLQGNGAAKNKVPRIETLWVKSNDSDKLF